MSTRPLVSDGLTQDASIWRFERKYFIDNLSKYSIEMELLQHPACFSEVYYPRKINNIYFDTIGMTAFRDNVEGVANRKKSRIRWYDETFGCIEKPVLEYKVKRGLLGRKSHFELCPFEINASLGLTKVLKALDTSSLPIWVSTEMKMLSAKLLNSYTRKYFLSADGRFRVTLDTDLKFIYTDISKRSFIWKNLNERSSIVELKYSVTDDFDAREISSRFRFRMTKSSKYVLGIQNTVLPGTYQF